jgi:Signal transduction histidine kinase
MATAVVTCPGQVILYGNRAFAKVAGLEAEQFLGHRIGNFFPRRLAADKLDEACKTGTPQHLREYETQIPHRSSPSFWDIDLIPVLELDNTARAIIVKAVEVTDRVLAQRRAEERAHEAEEAQRLLRALLQQVPVGILVADARSGRILLVSDYANRTASRPVEPGGTLHIDQVPEIWRIHPPDDRRALDPEDYPLLRAARRGENIEGERLVLKDPTGQEAVHLTSAVPIRDADGTIRWACVAWHDITSLERTQAALEKTLADKDMLLREVDHRVKNSLYLVSNLLAIQSLAEPDPRVRASLEDANSRVVAVGRIHGLLYRAGATSHLDFSQYLEELSASLISSMADVPPKDTPLIDAHRVPLPTEIAVPLALIANELLTNCLKYAYPGGPLGPIEIVFRSTGEVLILSVADKGIGLPAGFEPNSSEGFGMKMIQNIVQGYEGTFEAVNSHPGACFTVTIPYKAGGAQS